MALLGVAAAFLLSGPVKGTTVQITAFNRGHYVETGRHQSHQNTTTGNFGGFQNSYFAFDLTPIEGMTVVGATLELELYDYFGPAGSSHRYDLHSVTTDVMDVVATYPAGSPEGQAIWTDLGSGTFFGSDTVNQFPSGFPPANRMVPLNAAALAALSDAAGDLFAIGVTVPTAAPGGNVASGLSFSLDHFLFDPGPWDHVLHLDVVPAGVADPVRISAMSVTNDIIYLEFEGLTPGETVGVDRTTAILQEGWAPVHSFVPDASEAGWNEPRDGRNHALYRLTLD